jgi:hypothetical protein
VSRGPVDAAGPRRYGEDVLVAIVVVVLLVLVPFAILAWRFRRNDPPAAGGSLGRQLLGRRDDDWGPKPSGPS